MRVWKRKFIVCLLPVMGLCANAPAWEDFQAMGLGPGSDNRFAGLGFHLTLAGGQAFLEKPPVPFWGLQIFDTSAGNLQRRPQLNFGAVSDGSAVRNVAVLDRDWAHVLIEASESLKFYVSRLTPAVVVESTRGELILFGAGKPPCLPISQLTRQNAAPQPIALATPWGVVSRERIAELPLDDDLEYGWLLVWFGKDAGLHSTRFPWGYNMDLHGAPPSSSVDCPVLLVFQRSPERITVDSGLCFEFDETGAGRVALLPLFGDLYPSVNETKQWTPLQTSGPATLPEQIAKQCEWWAAHLREIPLTVSERCEHDPESDTIRITEEIRYLRLSEGGERFAPLPPMLALAHKHGFPMEFGGALVETSVNTAFGPYAGFAAAGQYVCELQGLAAYALETRRVGLDGQEGEQLNMLLSNEIDKIIQAGHLAPWYPATGVFGGPFKCYQVHSGWMNWSNPAETLYILGQALPMLQPDQRQELEEYLRKECEVYPPGAVVALSSREGARRERWRIDPDAPPRPYIVEQQRAKTIFEFHDLMMQESNFYLKNNLVPPQTFYYLSEYARAAGVMPEIAETWQELRELLEPFFTAQDWASLGWVQRPAHVKSREGTGGEPDANAFFAAMLGALRIARAAGDAEGEKFLWGQFARAAILRHAMGRYADYLHSKGFLLYPADPNVKKDMFETFCGWDAWPDLAAQFSGVHNGFVGLWGRASWMVDFMTGNWSARLYTLNWIGPEHDMRVITRMNEFGLDFEEAPWTYWSGFWPQYRGMVPELGRFLAGREKDRASMFAARLAEQVPDWYLAYSTAALGAENNYHVPETAYDGFMLRAWVLGEPPDRLAKYLDVSWMERGDLYYIHKLVETIAAYRGVEWEKEETQ